MRKAQLSWVTTVDNRAGIWCFGEVKFLPRSSSLLLLTLALSLSACATAANRRALYFPPKPGGLWHDYEVRRLAEAQTGINTAAYPSSALSKTPLPPSRPVPAGSEVGAPPPTTAPAVMAPDPGLPQVPAAPAADAPAPVAPPQ